VRLNNIDPTATCPKDAVFGDNVIVHAGVKIEEGVVIGSNVVVHANTTIGNSTVIEDNAVLGKQSRPGPTSTLKVAGDFPGLVVGDNCIIGSGAVIFAGSTIGASTSIGDLAVVRERCHIGDFVTIGCRVAVENDVSVGSYTKIQTGAYITAHVVLEERVFIAPMVTTTNDNTMGRGVNRFNKIKGARVKRGARVGGASLLLPGITIGREAFVAAGSVVTKDVPDGKLVMGIPARIIRDVPQDEWLSGK